jgi:hypothetical protein
MLPFTVGTRYVGPIDDQLFGILLGGDAQFGVLQAERIEQGIGDEGEGGGTGKADAVLAGEFEDFGQEVADLVNFREVAEFGEGIGGSGEGEFIGIIFCIAHNSGRTSTSNLQASSKSNGVKVPLGHQTVAIAR